MNAREALLVLAENPGPDGAKICTPGCEWPPGRYVWMTDNGKLRWENGYPKQLGGMGYALHPATEYELYEEPESEEPPPPDFPGLVAVPVMQIGLELEVKLPRSGLARLIDELPGYVDFSDFAYWNAAYERWVRSSTPRMYRDASGRLSCWQLSPRYEPVRPDYALFREEQ
ncbi:MAG: hypothetical protein PVH68_14690 [Armatimonadota bacterium]|jgi:hypothetical protein